MKYEEPIIMILEMDDASIIRTSLTPETGGSGPSIDLEGIS